MARILVNPGTSEAWEIELKQGPNRVGSSETNDFQIDHPSISGLHCEFIESEAGVLLKDLGSARGTYVNREPIKEAFLQPGQHIQLGAVAMIFEPSFSGSVHSSAEVMIAAPTPPLTVPVASPNLPALLGVGVVFCHNHPDAPGRFFCHRCQNHFCDACVAAHAAANCTTEGGTTLLHITETATPQDFFAALPRALTYPFRNNGLLILLASTLVFAGLTLLSEQIYGVMFAIVAATYLFAFLHNIIVSTASEKRQGPELPGFKELPRAFFGLAITGALSFGPAVALAMAAIRNDIQWPPAAIILAIIYGCAYFPMSFLAATIKDSVIAANPIIVVPALFKTLPPYLINIALMGGIFFSVLFATGMSSITSSPEPVAQKISTVLTVFGIRAAWCFLTVYLLTVNSRLLGLIYVTRKQTLGWFGR